jgi:hypothetical protein
MLLLCISEQTKKSIRSSQGRVVSEWIGDALNAFKHVKSQTSWKEIKMMLNFLAMMIGAWTVFFISLIVGNYASWAWYLWVPWLSFVTLGFVWHWWKRRKMRKNRKII